MNGWLNAHSTRLRVVLILGVASALYVGIAVAQGDDEVERVYKVGEGVTPPAPIHSPNPQYSKQARHAKLEGVCVLWMIVGADGLPRDIRVQRTLGLGLDEKAIEAVKKWKFKPAMKDGKPVAVRVSVQVNFHLY